MSKKKDPCAKYKEPQLENLEIKKIVVPEIRVTSVLPEELVEHFKRSIKMLGIVNPIKVICQDGQYILVDGLHRLQEAKDKGEATIPAVIVKGTVKDVLVQNLATGKLQGRGKITDMIKVVRYLYEEEGMGIDEIARSTGYREEYIDNLLKIANAAPEILEALDKEEIPLGAAIEITRIPDHDTQVTVLYQAIAYRMRVRDVKELVDRVLKLQQAPEEAAMEMKEEKPREETLIKCSLCGQEWPAREMRSIIICPHCYAAVMQVKAELEKELAAYNQHETPQPPGEGGGPVTPSEGGEPSPIGEVEIEEQ